MPGCSTCGKVWPDHFQACPEDGTRLYAHPQTPYPTHGTAAPALAPQASNDDLAPGSLAGEYRIEKKIGEGGMGSVYGARHPLIGKRAAIKVIRRELSGNPEAVDRFVLEAQSVNQIGHPNIVDVFGFGQLPDGRSFFVMEWLEGESLRDRLQKPLQFPEALEMLEAIAKALQAAHEAGVVHRDLKPDNVYLQARKGEKAEVKLLDFGLAKLTGGQEGGGHDRTRTGVVMGTPLYLSPEQAKGAKIDAATDVYSLGAMAFEMLSGRVPFKADSAVEIMAMHISQAPTPVMQIAPWVPPEIDALVTQMLAKDPAQRPSAQQVRERIAACRARASTATIGMVVNPSQLPAAWTPGSQPAIPGTPPPGVYTPAPTPPTPTPMSSSLGSSSMAQPSGGGKKIALILGALLLIGGGVAAAFVLVSKKKADSAQVASNEGSATEPSGSAEPAKTEPAGSATPTAGSAEPAKTEPAGSATEPAKTEPAGSATEPANTEPAGSAVEPGKTEPGKTEPGKTEPGKTEPVKTPNVKTVEPPKKKLGKVNVYFSGPARALILVDGRPLGRETDGKVTIELPPGEHTIRVQSKAFKPGIAKVSVEPGATKDVRLTLEKKSSVNNVHDPFAD